jgi:hypothetical protein
MTLLAQHADAEVHHATWLELAEVVRDRGGCDAVIVDAPYSERTHQGHDGGADEANAADLPAVRGNKKRLELGSRAVRRGLDSRAVRRGLDYAAWTPEDVAEFVAAWVPLTRGWIVSLTDHVLACAWEDAFEREGRYVFSPVACVEPGSRVRLVGDGPAQWSCWAVAARPRDGEWLERRATARMARNEKRALPGAYVVPAGHGERGREVVGGKPPWLLERLIEDYSEPGDLVVDPCAGGFTTGIACQRTGRRFIGGDALLEHAELGARRISRPAQQPLFLMGGER